jgi:predicted NBD/HSP70 family sugar kinase
MPKVRPRVRRDVLGALLATTGTRVTREEIASRAGVARGTATAALNALAREPGLLAPGDFGYELNARYGTVAVAAFGHDKIECAIGTLDGNLLATEGIDADADANAHASLDAAAALLTAFFAALPDVSLERVVGLGVAVASPVDYRTGMLRPLSYAASADAASRVALDSVPALSAMSDWLRVRPAGELAERLGWNCPVWLDNDANFAALAEFERARERWSERSRPEERDPLRDMIYVNWLPHGIGGGLVINGRVHSARGAAAEIGHCSVPGLEEQAVPRRACTRCGKHDCLENVAMLAKIRDEVPKWRRLGFDEFQRIPAVQERLRDNARLLGRVLAPLVNVLNPQLIVVGGLDRDLHGVIAPAIVGALAESATAPAQRDVQVWLGERHDAVVAGAARVVLRREAHEFLMEKTALLDGAGS